MVGLVVVSHSATAAEGIVDVAAEMGGDTAIEAAGGDDGIGTDADRISDALAAADDGDGVVVLVDLGSAVMNAEVAIEMHDGEAVIADGPVLEARSTPLSPQPIRRRAWSQSSSRPKPPPTSAKPEGRSRITTTCHRSVAISKPAYRPSRSTRSYINRPGVRLAG
jgi:dihydroxyacetone kinase DhaM subunit (EC 2.7.1.121)